MSGTSNAPQTGAQKNRWQDPVTQPEFASELSKLVTVENAVISRSTHPYPLHWFETPTSESSSIEVVAQKD
jgi:hypothetical protein